MTPTKELCELVQKRLFELGYSWFTGNNIHTRTNEFEAIAIHLSDTDDSQMYFYTDTLDVEEDFGSLDDLFLTDKYARRKKIDIGKYTCEIEKNGVYVQEEFFLTWDEIRELNKLLYTGANIVERSLPEIIQEIKVGCRVRVISKQGCDAIGIAHEELFEIGQEGIVRSVNSDRAYVKFDNGSSWNVAKSDLEVIG